MSNVHTSIGSNIPGYFLGRPRSVYQQRFAKSASVAYLDYTQVATAPLAKVA